MYKVPNNRGWALTSLTRFRHRLYFDTLHNCFPMINRTRYLAAQSLSPLNMEITSLSYAVWLHAASVSDKYIHLVERCYNSARKYLEKAESEDHMGTFMSIDALQACILIALYEFKQIYFARAWMSIGRAMRLAQMLGLHKMDQNESSVLATGFQPGLLPTNDPAELEERRRTFWVLWNCEWYASSRTRSPMNIDDTEVGLRLRPSFHQLLSASPTPNS